MNSSNFSHAGLALAAQQIIALMALALGASLFWGEAVGATFGIGFYFGREVAQVERKLGTPPWWSGFRFSHWSVDNRWDFLCPTAAVLLSTGAAACVNFFLQ